LSAQDHAEDRAQGHVQARAEAAAAAMWSEDRASAGLGMVLDHVGPGTATLSMRVEPEMLNGHGTCHGGFMFALADSAFAFACNSDGVGSVAAQCSIFFLRPVRAGERLVATAMERHREGRSGIYDVRVTAGDGVVAEFRGHSRTTAHRWLPDEA
jgi:acyl-CoA thioesterase